MHEAVERALRHTDLVGEGRVNTRKQSFSEGLPAKQVAPELQSRQVAQQVSGSFQWPIRVYYEDTDGGGVVYHANYLKFMERARTEWLRSLGFEQTELRTKFGVLFVVRRLKLQYLRPACFNDSLSVITQLVKTGRSLLEFQQTIQRNDEMLTEATVEVVCVDADQFKPVSIPALIHNTMKMMEPQ